MNCNISKVRSIRTQSYVKYRYKNSLSCIKPTLDVLNTFYWFSLGKRLIVVMMLTRVKLNVSAHVKFNSSTPSDTFQSTGPWFIHIKYFRLFGAKPLSESIMANLHWNLGNKFQCHLNQNAIVYIHGNGFKNAVCKMSAIFSRPRCADRKCF